MSQGEAAAVGQLAGACGRAQPERRRLRLELRTCVIVAGVIWSVAFVIAGPGYDLQLYGDGSIFSYAVAVQDAWSIHWHNISGRLFVYLYAHLPAEIYVGIAGDPRGGVVLYGLLFFVAPALSLLATFVLDQSRGRLVFSFACASTACLCPLVFGFPTETWLAHSLFWPSLAACHFLPRRRGGMALRIALLLALSLTHEGAWLLIGAILVSLALRGVRDPTFLAAARALVPVAAVWVAVKVMLPPDQYTAAVLYRAALHVFDIGILTGDLMRLLMAAFAGYALGYLILVRLLPDHAAIAAGGLVALALAGYWLWFDQALHAENRYFLRTVLLLATPVMGIAAAWQALAASGSLSRAWSRWQPFVAVLSGRGAERALGGLFAVLMLVHAVEVTKYVHAWNRYTSEVQALVASARLEPAPREPLFVSSRRISDSLNRLAWHSTTPYLSVLLAPRLSPKRLVVDPASNFFWLSCRLATDLMNAHRAVPIVARQMVRQESCRHRRAF